MYLRNERPRALRWHTHSGGQPQRRSLGLRIRPTRLMPEFYAASGTPPTGSSLPRGADGLRPCFGEAQVCTPRDELSEDIDLRLRPSGPRDLEPEPAALSPRPFSPHELARDSNH